MTTTPTTTPLRRRSVGRAGTAPALVVGTWLLLGWAGGVAAGATLLWGRWGRGTSTRALALSALLVVITAAAWLLGGVPGSFDIGTFTALGGRSWIDAAPRVGLGVLAAAVLLPTAPSTRAARPERATTRLDEVDRLRAIAIVTVVLIHGLPFRAAATGFIDHWLGDVTRFSVATLVFLSGWLLPRSPVGLRWLRRRLWRLLPPYLLASALMLAVSRVSPVLEAKPVVRSLLTASAVGPYYYVAVLVVLTLVTPLLLRLRRRVRFGLLVAAAIAALAIEVADLSLAAHNYLPLTWLVYYVAGHALRPLRDDLAATSDGMHMAVHTATTSILVGLAFVPVGTPARHVLVVLGMWSLLGSLLLVALRVRAAPHPLTRGLSRQSYLIYLYHAPLVAAVAGAFGSSVLSLLPVTGTAVAVTLCLAVGWLATLVWGDTARRWLGA